MSLAPYGVSDEASRGRLYPEPDSPTRSPFQRDRDRLIHAAAFRRLEGKTQVFSYHEGKSYRSRLTHSIEVAQITRTLCRRLRLNEDLGEALALAHDLGHAPFGHAGERGLKACMKNFGGFDHNINSLKLMTEKETHYPNFKGLNLTWETLEGTIKHNGPIKKISENWLENFNKKFPLDLEHNPSLEAQIASFSDDIAYNNHDIDDGIRAGFFTIETLCRLSFIKEIVSRFDKQHPDCDNTVRTYAVTRRLMTDMITDLVCTTQQNIKKFKIKTLQDIRTAPCFTADFSDEMHQKIFELKKFLKAHFYTHPTITRLDSQSQKIVEELFEAYKNTPSLLPKNLYVSFTDLKEDQKADIICAHIADMTDRAATEEHEKLCSGKTQKHTFLSFIKGL